MHHFGIIGNYLKNIGLGKDNTPLKTYFDFEQAKSMGHSRTLLKNTLNLGVVKSYLLMLTEKVGSRMREARLEGSTVNFFLRFGDFTGFSIQQNLKHSISDSSDIYFYANGLLKKALPLEKPVRAVGVSISRLCPQSAQEFLFEQDYRKKKFTETLDEINKLYGPFTIKPSSVIIAERFGSGEGCGMVAKEKIKYLRKNAKNML